MHYNLDRLFKRFEIGRLCREALQTSAKGMDTRQLAAWVIDKKGFPTPDRHLRKAVAYRIVQAMRMLDKRGVHIVRGGKNGNAIVWRIKT